MASSDDTSQPTTGDDAPTKHLKVLGPIEPDASPHATIGRLIARTALVADSAQHNQATDAMRNATSSASGSNVSTDAPGRSAPRRRRRWPWSRD